MKELRELILWHLDVFLHETAAFLAERLCASCPTDENFELLGLCYLRTAGVDGGPGARNTQVVVIHHHDCLVHGMLRLQYYKYLERYIHLWTCVLLCVDWHLIYARC